MPDWNYRGTAINPDRFLTLHEDVEKALIDAIAKSDAHDRMVLLACLGMTSPRDQIYHAYPV